MTPVEVIQGDGPVILGQPHGGTHVPETIKAQLNDNGRKLADTDWHIAKLYEGLLPGTTILRANFHRYVIDANRDPDGASLYPGQNTTALCPTTDFNGEAIYKSNQEPSVSEIRERLQAWHGPYHDALAAEISRVKALHGCVILFDCHSIRSHIPFLFEGRLPDFNIGTDEGKTCHRAIADAAVRVCSTAEGFTHVFNGRFKGGWTTRHYGRPQHGVHTIQMELAQATYMEEVPPWTYVPVSAEAVRHHLKTILKQVESLALTGQLQS